MKSRLYFRECRYQIKQKKMELNKKIAGVAELAVRRQSSKVVFTLKEILKGIGIFHMG